MTDRIRSFTVVLDQEYREDDVDGIRQALGMVKGVLRVIKGKPSDPVVEIGVKTDLFDKMVTLLGKELLGRDR
jgi:hypothetical protein